MIEDLKTLLLRDLEGMAQELRAYPDASLIWKELPGTPNSAGVLVQHCVGNLRHFIGAELGQSGYVRDRDGEFSGRDASRDELLELLQAAAKEVSAALDGAGAETLDDRVRLPGGKSVRRARFLQHLCTHLAYHLGQIDYHRRFTTGAGALPGIVGLGALDPGA